MDSNTEGQDILAANFHSVFRDVQGGKPRDGDVMARYAATAFLDDGELKRTIIELLRKHENGAKLAATLMTKIGKAHKTEAVRVPAEIAKDLTGGMTDREVYDKPYRYFLEAFYYVKPEFVPLDDPHWQTIPLQMCLEKQSDECSGDPAGDAHGQPELVLDLDPVQRDPAGGQG